MKPEQNEDFSWTVQHIEGEYWWFDEAGFPTGPYANYNEAINSLDDYCYEWDMKGAK